ncbi:putative serine carboxypeptidase [Aspergillus fijiensis CBS 313.89]|uniref:Carboxypeptidase n=1 Tax=Aspergillus fijiensis CBS 313.89 TaxID=1448319 RepID=A0A8G1W1A2_9EURO|nr:alpha/beta-hydrolase [Aspergillus fijiensis CBS 313.89]RAK80715.1 alpha/beta-hydrolase [Aspergillus fijiensis CBS 313.89]
MNLVAVYALIRMLWAFLPPSRLDVSQFEVHSLPGVPSSALPTSWAGQIPVPETEPGNSLFFWLFQAEDPAHDDNLIIWFNGGPGCSSLIGLLSGNGPFAFVGNSTELERNPHSWTQLGHVLYIDQPVGTGLSTASEPYPLSDNEGVTAYLYAWLQSFFTHFPQLRSKQIHLMGESYAGIYIPYLASAIVHHQASFPLHLRSISLGDATFGNSVAMSTIPTVAYMRSQQSRLQIPPEILDAFIEGDSICRFDQVLHQAAQYPPKGPIPIPEEAEDDNETPDQQQTCSSDTAAAAAMQPPLTTPEEILSSILNSTTCDGSCATFSTASRYLSTTAQNHHQCFDMYDITNNCTTLNPLPLLSSYFSRPDVQVALNLLPPSPSSPVSFQPSSSLSSSSSQASHLPSPANSRNSNPTTSETKKQSLPPSPSSSSSIPTTSRAQAYLPCNDTIRTLVLKDGQLPQPPADTILPDLITTHHIALHVYAGDSDFLLNHYGIELALQNMTWHGGQGFSRPFTGNYFHVDDAGFLRHTNHSSSLSSDTTCPADTSSCDDPLSPPPPPPVAAGLWTSSRGVTYHLFWGAGHAVFAKKPREMLAFVRDVVLDSAQWD